MDTISGLPYELLVRILSLVQLKVAVSTCILSKRWKFFWMSLPKLDFTDRDESLLVLKDFINKNLPLHRAPFIESFLLSFWTFLILLIRKKTWFPTTYQKPFEALLSICPVLEDLEVSFREDESIQEFTINVTSLWKLCLHVSYYWSSLERYEIDTPCLEYLELADWIDSPCLVKNMPKLEKAHVDVVSFVVKNVIGSVTSVKHLTVCSEDVYGDGIVFDQLEHLKLCICKDDSSNVLAQFLKDSPNLRVLVISQLDLHADLKTNEMGFWNHPSSVPECMLAVLSTDFELGRLLYRDIAVYILKNARHLRTSVLWANTNEHNVPNLEMIKGVVFPSFKHMRTCVY
ncbi:unnamed protein product [Brassica napus]|uniref:(rape) hypothetical protein n=1 Tax=Brassica napus TaxID=3708 RepID=A0A816LG88_BRANA|nr:unnamed protein product [Brassica napus]